MSIINITTNVTGLVGVNPRIDYVQTDGTDTLAEVTTAGWLPNNTVGGVNNIQETDMVLVNYDTGTSFFNVSVSDGVITLSIDSPDIVLPTVANRIAHFSDTKGTLSGTAANINSLGDISAGTSGTPGSLVSFPTTAAKGSLELEASDSAGDTLTKITNASMGQATTLTIPDPAGATGNFAIAAAALVNNNLVKASGTAGLVANAGYRVISNTTATYGGGGTSNAFVASGLTSSSKGSAVIRTSANAVSICKSVPSTDTLTITFSADPGAGTTVDYIYSSAAAS